MEAFNAIGKAAKFAVGLTREFEIGDDSARFGLITFADNATAHLGGTLSTDRDAIETEITTSMVAGGMTHISAAVEAAVLMIKDAKGPVSRADRTTIFLLTGTIVMARSRRDLGDLCARSW